MKFPIHKLIDILEKHVTEERCDALAAAVAGVAAKLAPASASKMVGGMVYTGIDMATPGPLFAGLRKIFPDDHEVELDEDEG